MQADKVRAVAVTSLDRMPQLPDVEPLQNGSPGLKGYELLNWFGLFTTAGTPAAVVNRYNEIATKTSGRAEDRGNRSQERLASNPGHRRRGEKARIKPENSENSPSSRRRARSSPP